MTFPAGVMLQKPSLATAVVRAVALDRRPIEPADGTGPDTPVFVGANTADVGNAFRRSHGGDTNVAVLHAHKAAGLICAPESAVAILAHRRTHIRRQTGGGVEQHVALWLGSHEAATVHAQPHIAVDVVRDGHRSFLGHGHVRQDAVHQAKDAIAFCCDPKRPVVRFENILDAEPSRRPVCFGINDAPAVVFDFRQMLARGDPHASGARRGDVERITCLVRVFVQTFLVMPAEKIAARHPQAFLLAVRKSKGRAARVHALGGSECLQLVAIPSQAF
ncbi:hypothetical protein [Termitidicoccus mucosus]|uniref:hypothetical protein n=1 Tax=Termitidicoccus mucosus TaxID=1184151 RepID=UPI003CCB768D